MDCKAFIENVEKSLYEYFGQDTKILVKEITKNNGVIMHGLIITIGKENISPTIYLDAFYEEYRDGRDFGAIIYDIVKIYEENRVEGEVNLDFFMEYDSVKNRIFLKVINYEKNKERLQELPHKRFLDLAVVCYYAYMNDFIGHGSIQIEIGHLDKWGISEETLFLDAKRNTNNKLGVEIKGMDQIIWEMIADKIDEFGEEEVKAVLLHAERKIPMYVMALKGRYFGAACICEKEMLKEFAIMQGKNFYILPSSIHELILIPDEGKEKPEELKRMVREVNSSHVAPEEQLSDNIYYFDSAENTVIML